MLSRLGIRGLTRLGAPRVVLILVSKNAVVFVRRTPKFRRDSKCPDRVIQFDGDLHFLRNQQ